MQKVVTRSTLTLLLVDIISEESQMDGMTAPSDDIILKHYFLQSSNVEWALMVVRPIGANMTL